MSARRFVGAGLMRRSARDGGRVASAAAVARANFEASLGAARLYDWEVPNDPASPYITIDGSTNVSSLVERVAGTANLVQATSGNRPAWTATGWVDGGACITIQGTTRTLAGTIAVAAANRVGLFVLGNMDPGDNRWLVSTWLAGSTVHVFFRSNLARFTINQDFTTTFSSLDITSPATDANSHLFDSMPLASGALCEIDGTVTTPDHAGSETGKALDEMRIGSTVALNRGGGKIKAIWLVDLTSGSAAAIAAIETYSRFLGATIA